jgi:hypothetical protein
MEQKELICIVLDHIDNNHSIASPSSMASVIYFVIKQHPEITHNNTTYAKTLQSIKKQLHEAYAWDLRDIHKCFCELYVLAKYIKKSS